MLNDEICKLREKLNESILNESDYNITYQISVQLDELIAQYYSTQIKLAKKTTKLKKSEKLITKWKAKIFNFSYTPKTVLKDLSF